jgi:Flp pilus assembly pilin Flp
MIAPSGDLEEDGMFGFPRQFLKDASGEASVQYILIAVGISIRLAMWAASLFLRGS